MTRYTVELEPMPGDWPPAAVRLRRLLRSARRAYGMQCTRCEPVERVELDLQEILDLDQEARP